MGISIKTKSYRFECSIALKCLLLKVEMSHTEKYNLLFLKVFQKKKKTKNKNATSKWR